MTSIRLTDDPVCPPTSGAPDTAVGYGGIGPKQAELDATVSVTPGVPRGARHDDADTGDGVLDRLHHFADRGTPAAPSGDGDADDGP